MIQRFAIIATGAEADGVWFLDRGGRQYRWRPTLPGEDGDSVIVRRDGRVLALPITPHDGLRRADDFTLGAMFEAFAKKAAAEREPGGR